VKQAIAQRKNLHLIAAKISELNWGRGLDFDTRKAVAAYLERHKMDTSEINVLGGNIYKNSTYYKRRLSEMLGADLIESVDSDWVQADPRLEEMGKGTGEDAEWARAESSRRARIRISYGIDERATGANIFTVKLRGVETPFVGVKWCGAGRKDPVGDAFPIETSESRAVRRVMSLVGNAMPSLGWNDDEEEVAILSTAVVEAKARMAEAEERHSRPLPLLSEGTVVTDGEVQSPHEETDDERLAFERQLAAEGR
jgi:hypothetical protein